MHSSNRRVFAYTRSDENETVLIVNNLSRFAQPAELDLRSFSDMIPIEMLGEHAFPKISTDPYFLSLSPYGYLWFRLVSKQ